MIKGTPMNFTRYNVMETNNISEITEMLAQPLPSYIEGILYFPFYEGEISPGGKLQSSANQSLDWASVDLHGKISKIDKKVPAHKTIHLDDKSVAILVFHSGFCDSAKICKGNEIIHDKFTFLKKFFV